MTEPQTISSVPFNDPRRAALAFADELTEAFERFLDSGRYVLGPEQAAFEAELAAFVGVDHCVGVASGTDALELALTASCPVGTTVLVAANCGGYTTVAARRAGFPLRYADVDPDTLGLSPATIVEALTPAVGAVVVTHLYGLVGDVDAIAALCRERGLLMVEDCAQAAGASPRGQAGRRIRGRRRVQLLPDEEPRRARRRRRADDVERADSPSALRALRQYGWETKYRVTTPGGGNSRLDELQAAVLRLRLRHLDDWNVARRAIVERYTASVPEGAGRFVAADGERLRRASRRTPLSGPRARSLDARGRRGRYRRSLPDSRPSPAGVARRPPGRTASGHRAGVRARPLASLLSGADRRGGRSRVRGPA